jgi:serine/threonine protein kinase
MSPELLGAGRFTRAADVWAFGIVLIELWEGASAFDDMTAAQIYYSIVQLKQQPKLPADCPGKYAVLIQGCLTQDPSERIDFKQILQQLRNVLDEL